MAKRAPEDAVRAALTSPNFQQRIAEANPRSTAEARALSLADLARGGVDVSAVTLTFRWKPGDRKLLVAVAPKRARKAGDGHA